MSGHGDEADGRHTVAAVETEPAATAAEVAVLRALNAESTDVGNGKRLIRLFGRDLRYCPQFKTWFFWNGVHWQRDDTGRIYQYAKEVTQVMLAQAAQEPNESSRKNLAGWAIYSSSRARIEAMIKLAESEPGVAVRPSELDADPMLLGVKNGVIELTFGRFRPAKRSDLITKTAGVEFDPKAVCPKFRAFVAQITGGDEELASYLQCLVGYCLTGRTSEQQFYIPFGPFGPGANGKTVFWEIIRSILGAYATTTPPDTLMMKRSGGGPSPDLARLQGVRLALASEPEEGSLLAEAQVKRMTGQDTIIARGLYQDFVEYVPQFKTVLLTNHKPFIRSNSEAIWRRIQLIPFSVVIPLEEQNKHLLDELKEELPGILNWALEGLRMYLRDGSSSPQCIKDAVAEYRSDMDIIADWIADCAIEEQGCLTLVGKLYRSYHGWCKESGHYPFGKKRFSQKLDERGFDKTRTSEGRNFIGLRLIAETIKLPLSLVKGDDP